MFKVEPLITEKSRQLLEGGTYTFKVPARISKPEIRKAINQLFDVTVDSLRVVKYESTTKVSMLTRKKSKVAAYKKAYVTLKEGKISNKVFNIK